MSEGYAGQGHASLDAHAYVDDSLTGAERAAFEAALRRDPKLRARVEAWEAQNEAIRLAFGAVAARTRAAPPAARPSNENNKPARALVRLEPLAAPRPGRYWRLGAVAAVAFAAAMAGAAGGPPDPREALLARAGAALRASADAPLDFASDDPRAVASWLRARFARIDPARLSPPGWSLLGVRVAPGLARSAALVLYQDALGGRALLWVEPTDATPALPPMGGRDADQTVIAGAEDGFAYAAVGPTRSGVGALAPVTEGD